MKIETTAVVAGCAACGDRPPVWLVWAKRTGAARSGGAVVSWTEESDEIALRAVSSALRAELAERARAEICRRVGLECQKRWSRRWPAASESAGTLLFGLSALKRGGVSADR